MDKLLRWRRGSDGFLFLQVLQDDIWVSYTQATHRKSDYQIIKYRELEIVEDLLLPKNIYD